MRSDLSGPVRKALDRHDPATARLFEAIGEFLAAVPAETVATCKPLVELVLQPPGRRWRDSSRRRGRATGRWSGRRCWPTDGWPGASPGGGRPAPRSRSIGCSLHRSACGRIGRPVRRPAEAGAPPAATHVSVAKRSVSPPRPGDSGRGTLRTASRLVTPGRGTALTTTGGRTIDALDKLADRRVLVTGGSGTIGARLVERLLELETGVVRVFGRDETKQFYQRQRHPGRSDLRFLIGDIRDRDRLHRAMEGIDLVFHCAALKHVESGEYNPFEATQTNVVGTQNVIDACLAADVRTMILTSSDKAANPTSVMGA